MSTNSIRHLIALSFLLLAALLTECGHGGATFCQGCGPTPGSQGAEFLYATSSRGQIFSFPIDRKSGALGTLAYISGPTSASGVASAQNRFLYVADKQHGVLDAFLINQTSGALTAVSGSPFSTSSLKSFPPLWLVAGPVVYTTAANGISGFTIGSNGALSTVVGSPYSGGLSGQAVLVQTNTTPANNFLYATNFLDPNGAISVYWLVAPASGLLTPVPGTFNTGKLTGPGAIVFDSAFSTSFVLVALNNSKQIAVFSADPSSGALTPVPGSPFVPGLAPTALALSAEQTFLYALNSLDDAMSVYRVASNGVLTPISGSPFPLGAEPGGIVITADDYLYISLPDSNVIEGFAINSASGELTTLPGSPFPALQAGLLSVVQIPSSSF
jgi:6-phosphogluconolactonase